MEELFYCEDMFQDAMHTLRKNAHEYFAQWLDTIHDTTKGIQLEVLDTGDPEDNGAPYNQEDKDGFIKAMEQYVLQFGSNTKAQLMQLRAMLNQDFFKFNRGTTVAAHATRYQAICQYIGRLPGNKQLTQEKIKLLVYCLFPKARKELFVARGYKVMDNEHLVNIIQHMEHCAIKSAMNDDKNKKNYKKGKQHDYNGGGRRKNAKH